MPPSTKIFFGIPRSQRKKIKFQNFLKTFPNFKKNLKFFLMKKINWKIRFERFNIIEMTIVAGIGWANSTSA